MDTHNDQAVVDLRLDTIQAGDNDRTVFSAQSISELADNIRQNGLAQPITVRPHPSEDGRYQVVAGERRFRAFCHLRDTQPGWDTIPAIVRTLTDEQADQIMLAENLQRKDLDVIDEAKAYEKRMNRYGLSVAEAAARYSVSEGRVRDRLKLLKLNEEVQHLVRHGQMPIGHALAMADLNHDNQIMALRRLRDSEKGGTKQMPAVVYQGVCAELLLNQMQVSMFDTFMNEPMPQPAPKPKLPTKRTSVMLELNGYATLYVTVEHLSNHEYEIDMAVLRQAIRRKETP